MPVMCGWVWQGEGGGCEWGGVWDVRLAVLLLLLLLLLAADACAPQRVKVRERVRFAKPKSTTFA